MRSYLASLILGVAVGMVYGFVKVRSPAPPAIALLGLLGMLAGEQAVRSPIKVRKRPVRRSAGGPRNSEPSTISALTEWSANSFLGLAQCFDTFIQANTLVVR